MRIRAITQLFLVVALVGSLVACGGGSSDGSGKQKSTSAGALGPGEGEDEVLFEIGSLLAVNNQPSAPSVAELPDARVTKIVTYHWNDATGATPGTVGLVAADGTEYGPFDTVGSDGQGGVPNAYWTATVDLELPAGTYEVVDSDPASWAWNDETGGRGMVTIYGVPT
jgi:hypothetical protein